MEGYGTDSEQIEALKHWWSKNGRYVVAGLVVAALVILGWRGWDYWQARQASAAAGLYASVVLAEQTNDNQAVAEAARAVIGQYPNTAYAALSGLALAKAEFVQQHFAKAEQALTTVMQDSPDAGFAAIARLRLASIQLQQGDAKAALSTLDKTKIAPAFAASADTLRGEAFVALSRYGAARTAWRGALAASDPTSGRYRLLSMRLSSLPAASATVPAKPAAGTTTPAHAATARAAEGTTGGTAR